MRKERNRVWYIADRHGNYYREIYDGKLTFTNDIRKAKKYNSETRAYEIANRGSGMTVISLLREGCR